MRVPVLSFAYSKTLLAACGAALLCCASAANAALAERFPSDDAVREELVRFVDKQRGGPGIAVGLIENGERRVIAYGKSGRAERPEVDGSTRFEIGSVTKTFTATLLADMILSGDVTEEQAIGTLFPAAIELSNGVELQTLGALATHRSGLPRLPTDAASVMRMLSDDPYAGTTKDDIYRSVTKLASEDVKPTTDSLEYSNLGYALLGRLLEEKAGKPYEELLTERVLLPLGLGDIATSHTTPLPDTMASGHGLWNLPAKYWHLDAYAPAGSLIASIDQMLVYLEANIEGTIPALREAQRSRVTFPDASGVGLGWHHASIDGESFIWHNGKTGGFQSFIGFLPEQKRGIVVLANGPKDFMPVVMRIVTAGE